MARKKLNAIVTNTQQGEPAYEASSANEAEVRHGDFSDREAAAFYLKFWESQGVYVQDRAPPVRKNKYGITKPIRTLAIDEQPLGRETPESEKKDSGNDIVDLVMAGETPVQRFAREDQLDQEVHESLELVDNEFDAKDAVRETTQAFYARQDRQDEQGLLPQEIVENENDGENTWLSLENDQNLVNRDLVVDASGRGHAPAGACKRGDSFMQGRTRWVVSWVAPNGNFFAIEAPRGCDTRSVIPPVACGCRAQLLIEQPRRRRASDLQLAMEERQLDIDIKADEADIAEARAALGHLEGLVGFWAP